MVNRNLVREYDVSEEDWAEAIGDALPDDMGWLKGGDVGPNQIVEGRVLRIDDDFVLVDVGYKSEGIIPRNEWEEGDAIPQIGETIRVLVEDTEDIAPGRQDDRGMIVLSKRKAEKIEKWMKVMETVHENDVVSGMVTRKIKGGLLVDIGVNVFLPASQVDIRRPHDIGEYIGKEIKCLVLKIDEARRNIVVSRRSLIEAERAQKKSELLKQLEVGQLRKGVVKNIADFGAFVDLGGIDGLLHITDMSWGRINHPSEVLKIDQEIEVKVLAIDKDKEKIALGLKQKDASPWEKIEEKYPIGSVHEASVVNIMSYGAFCKLEEGVEGLVHISEMSWTKRINHPSEVVAQDQKVKVKVLEINKDKQEISLGMKQVEENPWERVAEKYPPGSVVAGKVRNIANYGAFVEIEEGIDGLLHVADLSWTKKIGHPSEVLKKGEQIQAVVLSVDQEKQRIALGLKQMQEDPWQTVIPQNYRPGMVVKGHVTKIANFGVFVELEPGLEGLLHISEISDQKIEKPEEALKIGQELDVKILRVDSDERKIGLSLKRAQWAQDEEKKEEVRSQRAEKRGLRGGLEGGENTSGLGDIKIGE